MKESVRVSPVDGANSWQQSFASAGAKYTAGVNSVKTAPGQKAAAALPKWIASVTSKSVQDKFVSKVGAVSLEAWKSAATSTGVARLSQGATKGQPKYAAFAGKFYPHLSAGLQKIAGMPNITLQDRIQRAVAMMTHNSEYKG